MLTLAIAAFTGTGSRAWAAEGDANRAAARALGKEALASYERGDFDAALDKFERAHALVGFTTTSAKGAVTGKTVALGYVKHGADGQPLATPGEPGLVVECYGNRWPLELLERPPVAVGGKPELVVKQVAAASG